MLKSKRILLGIIASALCLSQCGYHLRGGAHDALSDPTGKVALTSEQPNSPLIKTLRKHIHALPVAEVDATHADIVLAVFDHHLWQTTRAVSSNTQVRRQTLTLRVSYQFTQADGTPLDSKREQTSTRTLTTDDNQMLGAAHEKWQIERDMHREISMQLLTQLRQQLIALHDAPTTPTADSTTQGSRDAAPRRD